MSDIAVRVVGLGKEYHIGAAKQSYSSLRESIMAGVSSPFRRAGRLMRGQAYGASDVGESFWALHDLNFEIKHGEVAAVIGHNGAGKSTLLKILSRITEPSVGYADIYGRVGALLEVGTGFHPELSGRENIYLNGSILGMGRHDIDRKFDEIVEFAEVEKFIDTPVKHYSSGMGLRLGFAVAAHLEPEILVVDEVLAVGDIAFQRKCLGKMNSVASEGRTVIFVSHNMGAVQALCTRGILLKKGQVVLTGEISAVVSAYMDSSVTEWVAQETGEKDENMDIRLKSVRAVQENMAEFFTTDAPTTIEIAYEIRKPLKNILLGFDLLSSDGVQLLRTYDTGLHQQEAQPGHYVSRVTFPPDLFKGTTYHVEVLTGVHRHGFMRRGDPRIRLIFNEPRLSDVSYPGVFQPMGEWQFMPDVEMATIS